MILFGFPFRHGHSRISKASQAAGSLPPFGRRMPSQPTFRLLSHQSQEQSSRLRARQSPEGRASTSCFAARAGEVRLLVTDITQRKTQFWAVQSAPPNPSIERTSNGLRPSAASPVKR